MSSPQQARGLDVFGVAAWFALFFGLLEGPGLVFFSSRAPLLSELGRHGAGVEMLWFAPLFDLALFLMVATALWLAVRVTPLPEWESSVALFAFLTFLGLLILPVVLHKVAAMTLAGGMTVGLFRWMRNRRPQVAGFMRRTLPVLGCIYVAIAASVVGGKLWIEAAAIRALPDATNRPNVLLIVADTLRADRLSAYGYARPTSPGIEKLAAEGVLFTGVHAPTSWTLPSHASMFTGLYPFQHGTRSRPLEKRFPTLADVLRQHGYATAAFVANTQFCHRHTGLARGFIHFEDYFGSFTDAAARTVFGARIVGRLAVRLGYFDYPGRKAAPQVHQDFLRWLDAHPQRPFFAFLNLMDVHDPFFPPAEYAAQFSTQPVALLDRIPVNQDTFVPGTTTAEQTQMESDAYDAAVARLDASVSELMQQLEQRGVLNNTLVIFTSDHGEMLFEHGLFGHAKSLYHPVLHVPLVMRLPGVVPAGLRDDRVASLTDLPASISAVAGIRAGWSGQNLLSEPLSARTVFASLQQNPFGARHWPNHDGWLKSAITNRWHFILHQDGRSKLFDRMEDPAELTNLAGTSDGAGLSVEFQRQLEAREGSHPHAGRSGND